MDFCEWLLANLCSLVSSQFPISRDFCRRLKFGSVRPLCSSYAYLGQRCFSVKFILSVLELATLRRRLPTSPKRPAVLLLSSGHVVVAVLCLGVYLILAWRSRGDLLPPDSATASPELYWIVCFWALCIVLAEDRACFEERRYRKLLDSASSIG